MIYFCEGFATSLVVLVIVLLVRYVKDAFRVGITPPSDFSE